MSDLIGNAVDDIAIVAEVEAKSSEPRPSNGAGYNGITADQVGSWGWLLVLAAWGIKAFSTKWLEWQSKTVDQHLELQKKERTVSILSEQQQENLFLQMVKDQNEAQQQALQTYMQASLDANRQLLEANKQLVSELQHLGEAINAVTKEMAVQGYKQTELLRHVERLSAVCMHNHRGVIDIQAKMGMQPRTVDWDESTEILSRDHTGD